MVIVIYFIRRNIKVHLQPVLQTYQNWFKRLCVKLDKNFYDMIWRMINILSTEDCPGKESYEQNFMLRDRFPLPIAFFYFFCHLWSICQFQWKGLKSCSTLTASHNLIFWLNLELMNRGPGVQNNKLSAICREMLLRRSFQWIITKEAIAF